MFFSTICMDHLSELHTKVMRQKTCLTALGSVFLGFAVSAAQRPTSSVPVNEKAAVVKTEHKPLKPLLKAPGLYQYFAPM